MSDLYFEINSRENKIVNFPIELETNWKNISGIIFLSTSELYDLSWAGYTDIGFVKICKENREIIKNLKCDSNILNVTKLKYKDIVTQNRYEKENSPLLIDNSFSIQLTEKNKLEFIMKYNECMLDDDLEFNWKTLSGHKKLNSKKFKNLYKKIQIYIQNLLDLEYDLYEKIEECKTIKELLDLDLSINCTTEIKL